MLAGRGALFGLARTLACVLELNFSLGGVSGEGAVLGQQRSMRRLLPSEVSAQGICRVCPLPGLGHVTVRLGERFSLRKGDHAEEFGALAEILAHPIKFPPGIRGAGFVAERVEGAVSRLDPAWHLRVGLEFRHRRTMIVEFAVDKIPDVLRGVLDGSRPLDPEAHRRLGKHVLPVVHQHVEGHDIPGKVPGRIFRIEVMPQPKQHRLLEGHAIPLAQGLGHLKRVSNHDDGAWPVARLLEHGQPHGKGATDPRILQDHQWRSAVLLVEHRQDLRGDGCSRVAITPLQRGCTPVVPRRPERRE